MAVTSLAFNPDQLRDAHGRWSSEGGGFDSFVGGLSHPDSGFTVQPVSGFQPTTGFAVSVYKGEENVIPAKSITPADLARFVRTNAHLLDQDDNYFGAWHNPHDGNVYLDVSKHVPDRESAARLGREHGQKAYFDFAGGHSVDLEEPPPEKPKSLYRDKLAFLLGDVEGHPFRGNQWTDGTGGGDGATTKKSDAGAGSGGGAGVSAATSGVAAKGRPDADPRADAVGQAYNAQHGLPPVQHDYVTLDEPRAHEIADAYDALPVDDHDNPVVREAYGALAKEVEAQFDHITASGMHFEPWTKAGQPYQSSTEMARDVAKNQHMYFFTGGEPHPLLGKHDPETGLSTNDKFRAVHDYFGHAAGGYGFGPRGEENAWRSHSQMLTPAARRALTTETRGQNSWFTVGRHNYNADGSYKNIPMKDRPFAQQKVALLPDKFVFSPEELEKRHDRTGKSLRAFGRGDSEGRIDAALEADRGRAPRLEGHILSAHAAARSSVAAKVSEGLLRRAARTTAGADQEGPLSHGRNLSRQGDQSGTAVGAEQPGAVSVELRAQSGQAVELAVQSRRDGHRDSGHLPGIGDSAGGRIEQTARQQSERRSASTVVGLREGEHPDRVVAREQPEAERDGRGVGASSGLDATIALSRKADQIYVAFLTRSSMHLGGQGSGNFGHVGRPGEVGGSGAGSGAFYHGTSNELAEHILAEGLKPLSDMDTSSPQGKGFAATSEKVAISYAAMASDDSVDTITVFVFKPEASRYFKPAGKDIGGTPGTWGHARSTEMSSTETVPPEMIQEVRHYKLSDAIDALGPRGGKQYADWESPLEDLEPVSVKKLSHREKLVFLLGDVEGHPFRGNQWTGGVSVVVNGEPIGLAAEARKAGSFEKFEHDFILDIKHGIYWHVTKDPKFTIDPAKGPTDASSIGGGDTTPGALMVTSHLENWDEFYNTDPDTEEPKVTRPYAVLVDLTEVPRKDYHQISRGFGNEFFIPDSSKAKVLAVVPVKTALAMDAEHQAALPQNDEELRAFYDKAVAGGKKKLSHREELALLLGDYEGHPFRGNQWTGTNGSPSHPASSIDVETAEEGGVWSTTHFSDDHDRQFTKTRHAYFHPESEFDDHNIQGQPGVLIRGEVTLQHPKVLDWRESSELTPQRIATLKSMGYDGVVDTDGQEMVAFSPATAFRETSRTDNVTGKSVGDQKPRVSPVLGVDWENTYHYPDFDKPDDHYYHVTLKPVADQIVNKQVLKPGAGSFMGRAVPGPHSKGRVFLTDKDGVSFWASRVEQHASDKYDNPPSVAVVRVPKSAVKNAQPDTIGTKDSGGHKAFFVEGPIQLHADRLQLGDAPGHPFRGNQYTDGEEDSTWPSSIDRPVDLPGLSPKANEVVRAIADSGIGSDYVHELYGSDPQEAFYKIDRLKDADVEQAKAHIKQVSQEMLRRKHGDELIAYRGYTGTEGKTPTISLTLREHTAKNHADMKARRGGPMRQHNEPYLGRVEQFRVKTSDVLSYSEAIGRGTFAEEEIIVPRSALKDLSHREKLALLLGGEGSGNFGHAGRPGEVGGSSAEGGSDPVHAARETVKAWSRAAHITPEQREAVNTILQGTVAGGPFEAFRPATGTIVFRAQDDDTLHEGPRSFSTSREYAEGMFGEKVFRLRISATHQALDMAKLGAVVGVDEGEIIVNVDGRVRRQARRVDDEDDDHDLSDRFALGGEGSGNFGHAGRPGEVGGSGAGGRSDEALRATVQTYTEDGSKEWNAALRRGAVPSYFQSEIADLSDAIRANPLTTERTFYRALPAKVFATLVDGEPFHDRGFVSASDDAEVAADMGETKHVARLVVPAGVGVLDVNAHIGTKHMFAWQREVILDHGHTFAVSRDGDNVTLHVREPKKLSDKDELTATAVGNILADQYNHRQSREEQKSYGSLADTTRFEAPFLQDKFVVSDTFRKMEIPIDAASPIGHVKPGAKSHSTDPIIVDANKGSFGRGMYGAPPRVVVLDGKHRLAEAKARGQKTITAYVGEKALPHVVTKHLGDFEGHPFRGNQWTGGGSSDYAAHPRVFNKTDEVGQFDSWGEKKWGWKDPETGEVTGRLLTGEPIKHEDLPETLYHVTTNAPAVEKSGVLLGQLESGGLGGGQAEGVSFTRSKEDARVIQRELVRAVKIARGDTDETTFDQWAREDEKEAGLPEGSLTPASKEAVQQWEGNKNIMDRPYHYMRVANPEWIGGKLERIETPAPPDERERLRRSALKDSFNMYLWSRETASQKATGHKVELLKNPILFGDQDKLKKLDPDNISTLTVPTKNIPAKALVTTGSDKFLHEVRAYSDVPTEGASAQKLSYRAKLAFLLGGAGSGNFGHAGRPGEVGGSGPGGSGTPAFKAWFKDSAVVDEDGDPLIVYHGTTHPLESFKAAGEEGLNPESDWGAGVYFTSDPEDASENYAGEGPDLSSRIEQRADQLESTEDLSTEDAHARARAELAGKSPEIIPAFISMQNPVVVGKPNGTSSAKETHFYMEYKYADPKDPDSDIVGEEGTLPDFLGHLRDEASQYHDGPRAVDALAEKLSGEDYVSASRLQKLWKETEETLDHPETGALMNHEVFRAALQRTGFDGVVDRSVHDKFGKGGEARRGHGGGMEHLNQDTTHFVAFKPTQVKSAIGNKGTFDPKNPKIAMSYQQKLAFLLDKDEHGYGSYKRGEGPRKAKGEPRPGTKRYFKTTRQGPPAASLKQAQAQGFTDGPYYHSSDYVDEIERDGFLSRGAEPWELDDPGTMEEFHKWGTAHPTMFAKDKADVVEGEKRGAYGNDVITVYLKPGAVKDAGGQTLLGGFYVVDPRDAMPIKGTKEQARKVREDREPVENVQKYSVVERSALLLGDVEGHPFRGNQWTGGGSAGERASAIVDTMAVLKDKYPIVAANYPRDSGTEMGSIEEHTKDVAREWANQLPSDTLAGISDRFGSNVEKLMATAIPLHDIGKPDALEEGDKSRQHEHTVPILQDVLRKEGFKEKDVRLATELINHDMLGRLAHGRSPASDHQAVAEKILAKAAKVGMDPKDFATLQVAFFQADASAYPYITQFMERDGAKWNFDKKLAALHAALGRPVKKLSFLLGGTGSGNFGHAGRVGEVGGSAPGSGGAADAPVLQGVDFQANAAALIASHEANPEEAAAAEAELRELPLVHGTTVAGAIGAITDGLRSHAEMDEHADELRLEANDLREELKDSPLGGLDEDWSGWDAEEISRVTDLNHSDATELAAKIHELTDLERVVDGATFESDKALGLDRFVFMTHGQKHPDYGDVGVVIDNKIMPTVVASPSDIAADGGGGSEPYSPTLVEKYRHELVKGDDYYKVAAAEAAVRPGGVTHRDRGDLFEIKAPTVPKSAVKGFVVYSSIEEAERLADRLRSKGIKNKVLYVDQMAGGKTSDYLNHQLKAMQATGRWDDDEREKFDDATGNSGTTYIFRRA